MEDFKLIANILNIIITIATLSVFVAILVDFVLYNDKNDVKKKKKSIVATGTMIVFYIIYYLVIRLEICTFSVVDYWSYKPQLTIFFMSVGTVCVVAGAIINVVGRLELKGNWGNHIKIYKGHSLVNTGVYKIVRHPLYASIMLMLFGGSIFYFNWLSAVLVIVIFIPAMTYRAKQEEVMLMNEFPEYSAYKENVGMFFPKLFKKN